LLILRVPSGAFGGSAAGRADLIRPHLRPIFATFARNFDLILALDAKISKKFRFFRALQLITI
jgi:hypothetical protein